MSNIIDQASWSSFLRKYTAENEGRPTSLGVIETRNNVANDYWVEDGLPLVGLDVYPDKGATRVDIIFNNFTHSVIDAAMLVHVTDDSTDFGIDVSDAHGMTAILRFENYTNRGED